MKGQWVHSDIGCTVTVDCTVTVGAQWLWVHSDSGCTVTVGAQWLWVHSDCGLHSDSGCTVTVGAQWQWVHSDCGCTVTVVAQWQWATHRLRGEKASMCRFKLWPEADCGLPNSLKLMVTVMIELNYLLTCLLTGQRIDQLKWEHSNKQPINTAQQERRY